MTASTAARRFRDDPFGGCLGLIAVTARGQTTFDGARGEGPAASLRDVLDILAVTTACLAVGVAIVAGVGLSERGQSGRPVYSAFAAVLVLSSLATAVIVVREVGTDASPLLAVAALPPLTMGALMVIDPSATWGNFPPSRARRWIERVLAIGVLALPGVLAVLATT